MKIFRLFYTADNLQMRVVALPDTALLLRKNPFFIPDFATCCTAQLCVAVRIHRLGRSIHQHFASRYYDKSCVTLGVHFVAENLLNDLRLAHAPWDLAVGFDNAVAVPDEVVQSLQIGDVATLQLNEAKAEVRVPANFFQQTDETIAQISQYYTLRQGDLLLFPLPITPQEVHIDDRIALLIDGNEHFAFHIK